jgi:alcohol dehydrogenase class IV
VLGDQQSLVSDALMAGWNTSDSRRSGAAAADLMTDLVSRLPLPQRLRDVGVGSDELAEIARSTLSDYMMANLPRTLLEQEVLALLQEAW